MRVNQPFEGLFYPMDDQAAIPQRFILLGASNLTIGFSLLLEELTSGSDRPLDVYAALGHGRSYGQWNRVLHRALPGIVQCALWKTLQQTETPPSRPLALLTDVGNDLLYGAPVERILEWVRICLDHLKQQQAQVVVTTLPIESLQALSAWRYHLTRMIFFPGKGTAWPEMQQRVYDLNDRLRDLAREHGAQIVEPAADWYGFDPIHIRRSRRREAWRQIISGWPAGSVTPHTQRISRNTRRRLWTHQPAVRRVFGREQVTGQPFRTTEGMRVFLY